MNAAAQVQGGPLAEEALGALTLGGFLREVCERHGPREAMVFHAEDGSVQRLSYAQLWEQANALARALLARGVLKQTRVGLLATNRPEWLIAAFSIVLAGGTCVALSTFAKRAELEYQLRVADVSLLIFERRVLERDFAAELLDLCPALATQSPLLSPQLPFLRAAVSIGAPPQAAGIESWTALLDSPRQVPQALVTAAAAEVAPTDHGLVFFSSGSTAKPKAILHTHRAAAIQCWRWPRIFAVDREVRTWSANGFFWSGNFAMALGTTLAAGGSLVLQRVFNPGEALRLMQAERVSLPVAWPHQWARLVEDPAYAGTDLSSLRYVGEASPLRRHPSVKSDWQEPVSAYGNTETFTLSTMHPSGTPSEIAGNNHGYPQPGNSVRVVEPLSGRVLQRGEAGEIAVKGPTLMLGYLRVPAEETFDAEGFFRTGDGGFIDAQGRLHWQGRLNDIIKTGGANVSPLEIDAVIAECPGVKIIATVGVPHDTLGEMVVSCVVPQNGASLDEAAVRSFAAQRLSSYKVPRRVLILSEADLSMTGSNKVKTAPLRELAARRLQNA
ncbi:AMP-binding enzyme C-terminal domain-containing protein [Solimonas aquatica]|uniref:AMP-binding enzyme C-terminal domain-containing protein n=1 Tax=Solimonas aquatica TaxID=489703 RepID=A0A1H9KC47_9GAMM|nr:class I adenylate-forming enzyme family protein [Solimonas aquatica]SEQ96730.1 AMP-binding enzyme C-terminal domain-containing protein [Solimonas aquatica]